jgi:hypothetical protein
MDTKSAAASNPTAESAPRNITSAADRQQKPERPRMIGDFDGSASELWKLFKDEAKSHDDARIYSLKEDMESALIFVRSYSLCAYYGLSHADALPHRLVYFPLPSQGSYSTANKTYRSSQQMKWSITSDNTQPSFLKFPCNYLPLPHKFPSLPLHQPLSPHSAP